MANQKTTQTIKFHGEVIKRVLIVSQKNSCDTFGFSDCEFIRKRFNSLRNFRSFSNDYPVDIISARTDNLPSPASLQKGDACLLIGNGRLVDKECYDFAKECFSLSIPVFFIRSNSLEYDSRTDSTIWKTHTMVVKTASGKKFTSPPSKYFMEIPSIQDLILAHCTDDFYALLPGMVPM